jgi:exopolysaccharide production protein ExoZ
LQSTGTEQAITTRRPLLSIQYLRAVAALMVVLYHANRWAWRDFDIGAAGVDIFFVISGFVLWTSISERPLGPFLFLRRRLARVAPLYWILTLLVAGAAALWPGLFFEAHPTLGHVLLSLAFIQHFNPVGRPFPVISAGWSLNYEMIFYLVMATALFLPKAARFRALIFGLVAVVAFGFIDHPAYFLGANPMFLQFAAGVVLARVALEERLPPRRFGYVCVALGVAGFAVASRFDLFEHLWRPLFWGAPALLLVMGAVTVERAGRLPHIEPLQRLGDASYSIYLCHVIITELLTNVIPTSQWIYVPIAFGVSVVVGLLCHLAIERPLLALFHTRAGGAVLRRAPT